MWDPCIRDSRSHIRQEENGWLWTPVLHEPKVGALPQISNLGHNLNMCYLLLVFQKRKINFLNRASFSLK